MPVDRRELLAFLRAQRYAVEASVSAGGAPQAAVVGVVVTDALEVFFDTERSSRKYRNLAREPRAALVFWEGERTVQLEGRADAPEGAELARLMELYLAKFPDGKERQAWPDIGYVRITPTWIRMSDFGVAPPRIDELELT